MHTNTSCGRRMKALWWQFLCVWRVVPSYVCYLALLKAFYLEWSRHGLLFVGAYILCAVCLKRIGPLTMVMMLPTCSAALLAHSQYCFGINASAIILGVGAARPYGEIRYSRRINHGSNIDVTVY